MGKLFFRPWCLWFVLGLTSAFGARAFEIELSQVAVPTNGDGVVIASLSVSSIDPLNSATFPVMVAGSDTRIDQFTVGRTLFSLQEQLSGADGRWGRVVAIKLKPGEYRFGPVTFMLTARSGGKFRVSADLKRTFLVEPNKVIYVGNLDVLSGAEPGFSLGHALGLVLFGFQGADAQAQPHVRDMWDADLKVLRAQHPGFDPNWVEKRLMRDARDDAIEKTIADVRARAYEGHRWAQAAWAEASVLGFTRLPDLRYLRLPGTLAFNATTLKAYMASAGDPVPLAALTQWTVEQPYTRFRAPIDVDGATAQALVRVSADRYAWEGASMLARDERFGAAGDAAEARVWKHRQSAVAMRGRLNGTELLEALIGKEATQVLADAKGKRKMVAMASGGRHFTWVSEGDETVEAAAEQLIKRCADESGEACWIVVSENSGRPPVCNASMYATRLAQSHPPSTWPDVSEQTLVDKPWTDAYRQWQSEGTTAAIHPRSMVWDEGLRQAFTASGDCMASHRARTACKARGGLVCEVVVQDDKLVAPASASAPGHSGKS
jgi:hypothetical protein